MPPAPADGRRTGRRRDLQGLRGVAVLGVVIYHLRSSWLPGGFAGVDVFFVLSGFFITGLLLRELDRTGRIGLRDFWARRARRLLPASLLVLVTTVVAGDLLTNPLEAQRIARDGLYATVFAMNWHAAASGLAYGQDPDPSPFQHYWSLGVEEQFYLVWPVLLVGAALLWRRAGGLSPRRTIVVFAVAAAVSSFALALRQTAGNQPYAYYGTLGRVWELAVGGILAAVLARPVAPDAPDAPDAWSRSAPLARSAGRAAGLVLIVGFYVLGPSASSYPGWWSLLPASGAALLVAAGASDGRRDPAARLLGSRLGQLGGRYSYGWYLWHWPPLVLLPIALDRPLRIRELGWCAAGTFALAVVTFHALEDPVRRHRWLAGHHFGRSLRLGVALLAVGLAVSESTMWAAEHAAARAHVVAADHRVLRPQPAAAAAEVPQVDRDGCQLPISSSAVAPECRYLKDRGRGDVVLVGDSHAGMWFPAVRQIAVDNKWGLRVWARTSCPFADVRKSVTRGSEYHECDQWREDVLRRLIAAPPSLVIVASYAQSSLHVNDPRTGGGAAQPRAHELFRAGMQRNLARLRAAGVPTLVIRDVPAFARAAPDCALAHPDDLATCSLPESEAVPYGASDAEAARAVPGVTVADFTNQFCHGGRCYQVVDDILGYRDVNHITTELALHLAPGLERAARRAVR